MPGNAFTAGTALPTVADGANKLLLIDVDEDGVADLLRTTANGITLALGTGQGGFMVTPGRLPTLLTQATGLLAADFDRDGDPDVLTTEPFVSPTLLVNRHRDLRPDQPLLGQVWQPEVWSQPGYATFSHGVVLGIALAALPQPVAIAGLGEVALDPNGPLLLAPGLVAPNGTPARFPFVVPNAPLLAGVTLHVQAIVDQAPAHVSAWFAVAIR
ncbi:MAG: VCBS repeat-containing protein [Planctomycetes bacterium]|nr:VCBS repeat-containing protein [Planctomycetota bacterium]